MVGFGRFVRATQRKAVGWYRQGTRRGIKVPGILIFYLLVFTLIFGFGFRRWNPGPGKAAPAFAFGASVSYPDDDLKAAGFALRWLNFDDSTLKLLLQNEIPLLALVSGTQADLERESAARVLVDGIIYQVTGIRVGRPVTFLSSQIPFLANVSISTANPLNSRLDPAVVVWPEKPGGGNPAQAEVVQPVTLPSGPIRSKLPPATQPDIIIYHTHTTESFLPTSGQDFTTDLNFTVAKVGSELARALQAKNIQVAHDQTVHDVPGRLGAYSRAVPTVSSLVKRYPSATMVIDLHRDALPKERVTATVGGQSVARVLFVVGTDKLLAHPDWADNYEFVARLVTEIEKMYPGLSRGIDLREDRFNQQYHPHAILLEIGSNESTLVEAQRTAWLIAEVLAKFIKS